MKRIAVIGGGASGIIAACFAAKKNVNVVLFEKEKKLARKIYITGNGRCNITNRNISVLNYHGRNRDFVHNVFSRFGLEETINFFSSIGLPLVEEENGKLYPASLQASSVALLLEYELHKKKIDIRLHRRIDKINHEKDYFKLITAGKEEHEFDAVILSSGSCAYPQVGSSRIGYELAESLKHRVYEPFPAILPINIPLKIIHKLQGIKMDCAVKAVCNDKIISSTEGELLFTGYGISGPASLSVSRAVNNEIIQGNNPEIIIDLFPKYSDDDFIELLKSLWTDNSKSISFSLLGILKQRMPDVFLEIAGIDPEKRVSALSKNEISMLVKTLKALTLHPGRPRGFDEAVVAAGGVDVNEINPTTMESRIIKNLYITGELLDIDGDSGGYNLQFAWSSGAIAGMAQ